MLVQCITAALISCTAVVVGCCEKLMACKSLTLPWSDFAVAETLVERMEQHRADPNMQVSQL